MGKIKFTEKENQKNIKVNINLQGLQKNKKYGIVIHENGNVSNQCKKVGSVFSPPQGYLATLVSNEKGQIDVTLNKVNLKVSGKGKNSIINRSCVIHKPKDQSYEKHYTAEMAGQAKDKIVDCAKIQG